MQRLRPSSDEAGIMEMSAHQDPYIMLSSALQQLFADQWPPMHLHGLATKVNRLEYEDRVSSRKDRTNTNKDGIGKSVYPIRRAEPQFERTSLVLEATDIPSAVVARQRQGYVDQLLKTPDYADIDVPAEIIKLLRDRLCRLAVFYLLAQEDLRRNNKLLGLVQETIYMELRSVAEGKPHDLAVRLGWTAKGMERGAAREALHQQMVIQQGRLPSMKEIGKAVLADNHDPHQRFDLMTVCSSPEQAKGTAAQQGHSEPSIRTTEEWTLYYNQQLHKQILEGSKANRTRKDGQKAIHHPRPAGGLQQLSTLLNRIHSLKRNRGFQPDWVTVNLVVKTWLRGLSASKEGAAFGANDIFKAFKDTVTMDIIKKQNLDFDRDIQPLVKMLVKALKGNGEWMNAREVLAWMVDIRDTMAAEAGHSEQEEVAAVAKPKGRTLKSEPSGRSLMRSVEEIAGGREKEAEKIEYEAVADEDNDKPSLDAPSARIITMKHFEIAMQEITPSSSESGNLPELRKVG